MRERERNERCIIVLAINKLTEALSIVALLPSLHIQPFFPLLSDSNSARYVSEFPWLPHDYSCLSPSLSYLAFSFGFPLSDHPTSISIFRFFDPSFFAFCFITFRSNPVSEFLSNHRSTDILMFFSFFSFHIRGSVVLISV